MNFFESLDQFLITSDCLSSQKSYWHWVNAPIIDEFPVVMECELLEFLNSDYVSGVVGKIVNVKAEEAVLDENGKVDPSRLNALIFDQFRNGYYVSGEKVGQAWNAGVPLMRK